MKITNIFLILLLVATIGCKQENKPMNYESIQEKADMFSGKVEYISPEELKTQFDNNGFYLLVDCREENEYAKEHINNSVNVPRGMLEFSKKLKNKNARIILYCDSSNRAVLGAASLLKMNYSRLKVLKGGFEDWKNKFPNEVEASSEDDMPEEDNSCG